jgi:hypothetical protein
MTLTLYFDMDGVLTDYDGQLAQEALVSRADLVSDRAFRREFENARKKRLGVDHYKSIPPNDLDGFRSLLAELAGDFSCEILTSYGDPDPSDGGVMAHVGKMEWLNRYYGDFLSNRVLRRFNGVPSCTQKGLFGRVGSFLVDDQEDNVAAFSANGGGIFHYTMGCSVDSIRSSIQRYFEPLVGC